MEYPEILSTQNTWIIGLTQEPSTRAYYVIFYYDIYAILGKQRCFNYFGKMYINIPYSDFDEFSDIGSGGYGTVHTAKYKYRSLSLSYGNIPEYVVLKRFKRFDGTPELFINEVIIFDIIIIN